VREWLIAIGVLVFLGIMLDCLRRMRGAKRDTLDMSAAMQQGIKGDVLDEASAELPNGGARVVENRQVPSTADIKPSEPSIQTPESRPEVDLEQIVPMLMDEGMDDSSDDGRREPTFSDDKDMLMGGDSAVLSKPRVVERPAEEDGEQEVIILNVMSRRGEGFQGAALLENVLSCGMRFGHMNIFHYYADDKEEGNPIYSMANIVKPGTFDLNSMDSFKSPGVSFFLTLPLSDDNASAMDAFDNMLNTAKQLVNNLDGELKDENRSVMTGQTIEHCRQRISDFARRKLSRTSGFSASR